MISKWSWSANTACIRSCSDIKRSSDCTAAWGTFSINQESFSLCVPSHCGGFEELLTIGVISRPKPWAHSYLGSFPLLPGPEIQLNFRDWRLQANQLHYSEANSPLNDPLSIPKCVQKMAKPEVSHSHNKCSHNAKKKKSNQNTEVKDLEWCSLQSCRSCQSTVHIRKSQGHFLAEKKPDDFVAFLEERALLVRFW